MSRTTIVIGAMVAISLLLVALLLQNSRLKRAESILLHQAQTLEAQRKDISQALDIAARIDSLAALQRAQVAQLNRRADSLQRIARAAQSDRNIAFRRIQQAAAKEAVDISELQKRLQNEGFQKPNDAASSRLDGLDGLPSDGATH